MDADPPSSTQPSDLTIPDPPEGRRARTWTWTLAQKNRSRRKAAFLRSLKRLGSIRAASADSGIDESTIYKWRKQYPAFNTAVLDFTQNIRVSRIEESLYTIATNIDGEKPDLKAAVKAGEVLLRAWDKERYGDQLQVNHQVTINQGVQILDDFKARQRAAMQALTPGHIEDATFTVIQEEKETA